VGHPPECPPAAAASQLRAPPRCAGSGPQPQQSRSSRKTCAAVCRCGVPARDAAARVATLARQLLRWPPSAHACVCGLPRVSCAACAARAIWPGRLWAAATPCLPTVILWVGAGGALPLCAVLCCARMCLLCCSALAPTHGASMHRDKRTCLRVIPPMCVRAVALAVQTTASPPSLARPPRLTGPLRTTSAPLATKRSCLSAQTCPGAQPLPSWTGVFFCLVATRFAASRTQRVLRPREHVSETLQYDSAEWRPAFLRQAREFLFFPLLPRDASK